MFLRIIVLIFFNARTTFELTSPLSSSPSDLSYLVTTNYFVDKTDIIKELFQSANMLMISAPRRFGKTVNMDIIRRFCEVVVNENGSIVPASKTKNYELFTRHNLNIVKDKAFFDTHFGKYPVIYLNFRTLKFKSYTSFVDSFKQLISETYLSHKYLLRSTMLDKDQLEIFQGYYEESTMKSLKYFELPTSMSALSYMLNTHFNQSNVVILVDNLDTSIHKAILKPWPVTKFYKKRIFDIFFVFLAFTFKSNSYIEKSLINTRTMLHPVSNEEEANLTYVPFMNNHVNWSFSSFYGFSEREVRTLLENLKMSEKLTNLRKWYSGYKQIPRLVTVYSPSSVVNYLQSNELKTYFVKPDDDEVKHLKKLLSHKKVQNKINQILFHNSTRIKYVHKLNTKHLVRLNKIILNPKVIRNPDVDLFLQLMTDEGYFNIVCPVDDGQILINIPNQEIVQFIHSIQNKTKLLKN